VVMPAAQLVNAANLDVRHAAFGFQSCSGHGDPPYRSWVRVEFAVPPGVGATAFRRQVAAVAARLPGWGAGTPSGAVQDPDVVHAGDVPVTVAAGPTAGLGELNLIGMCRNMNDHRTDTGERDVTKDVGGAAAAPDRAGPGDLKVSDRGKERAQQDRHDR
jgi:hypothetical protein